MKTLLTFLLLAVAASVTDARWADGESMLARKATIETRSTESIAALPSANQAAHPSGRFILTPDNNGRLNLDISLARRFQHAIDSVGDKYGVRGMSAAVLIPGQGIWLATYGYSTTAPDSIRTETIFNVASQISRETTMGTHRLSLRLGIYGHLSPRERGKRCTSFKLASGERFVARIHFFESVSALYHQLLETSVCGENSIPSTISLEQNYPNPFNPTTTINYQLPTVNHVALKVFDVLGREVANLVDGVEESGYHNVQRSMANCQVECTSIGCRREDSSKQKQC